MPRNMRSWLPRVSKARRTYQCDRYYCTQPIPKGSEYVIYPAGRVKMHVPCFEKNHPEFEKVESW